MMTSAARICRPNISTASGISATDGTGRRNSTVVWVARRRNGTIPTTVPSATAASVATVRPIAHDVMVSRTRRQNARSRTSSANRPNTSVGYGR